MRWLLVLILLAGCRQLLGIDDGKPSHPDAAVDARIDASPYDGARDGMGGCPNDFVALGGQAHRYRRITTTADWTQQRLVCESFGTYLVVPDDVAELQAVTTFAANATIWVGIADANGTGTYTTVLGSAATFLPWAAGEPTTGGNMHCVLDGANTQTYSNELCTVVEPAVCECNP